MTNREKLMNEINEMSDEQLAEILYDNWFLSIVCRRCKLRVDGKCPLKDDEDWKVDEIKWLSEEAK